MNLSLPPTVVEFTHFHFFCGLGAAAKGFNKGSARVGNLRARFRCLGGIDNNAAAIRDFSRLAGVPGTLLDLFDEDQYRAFHGVAPPRGWREATLDDIRRAAQGEFPDIVFLSAPCKGFSGLLPESSSKTAKYQALNRLTLRGVWLMLEAFKEKKPKLIVFENVPRIATRGRGLLDQIVALLRSYGYAVAETTHDCGELGGLGQSRKRFLLVARLEEEVPPFLYEPEKRSLRGVGEILEKLPEPADRLVAVIRALDGTWHRPFTTLELAALQSLVDPDEVFTLDGQSDSAWRERIGNAVPPDAAEAIAGVMGTTLLLAMTGQTFILSNQPIWVQPIALALSIDQRGNVPAEPMET